MQAASTLPYYNYEAHCSWIKQASQPWKQNSVRPIASRYSDPSFCDFQSPSSFSTRVALPRKLQIVQTTNFRLNNHDTGHWLLCRVHLSGHRYHIYFRKLNEVNSEFCKRLFSALKFCAILISANDLLGTINRVALILRSFVWQPLRQEGGSTGTKYRKKKVTHLKPKKINCDKKHSTKQRSNIKGMKVIITNAHEITNRTANRRCLDT